MKRLLLLFGAVACWTSLSAQLQYTFTTGGATGQNGPSQTDINTAYTGTNLAGQVTVNAGIQYWVVPQSGYYSIQALGAQGYGPFGGRGADMYGEFALTAGDSIKILVGQEGAPPVGSGTNQFGGGGGSFVTYTNNTPLIVAGGGGGSWATSFTSTTDASTSTSGNTAANAPTNGAGGVNGSGGGAASIAGGGGGLTGDGGLSPYGGLAFVNGGTGGRALTNGGEGGFGGGGGANSYNNRRCGGGGGYSGGGGAGSSTTALSEGGGGGSFNSGANPVNTASVQLGDGLVVVTPLSTGATNDIGVISIDAPNNFCAGTRSVISTIQNFGSNRVTTATVNWSINGVTQTAYSFTGVLDTTGGTGSVSAQVTVGTYSFLANTPYTIDVWTSLPNGQTDTVSMNDTVTDIRQSGLVAPTGLAASNITGTTADISWNTLGGAGYLLEYGPLGFTPGTGTVVTGTTAGYTLLGLNPTTDYDVYLADSCGVNDIGAWAGPMSFATGCITTASGTYTIDQNAAPTATNYVSFSQLAFALNTCGMSGPVTVNVVTGSGPYYEQFTLNNITGSSSTNTITINGNGTTISDTGNVGSNNAVILLDGAEYVTIDSLNIINTKTSNAVGVQFMNQADYNIVRNCNIEMSLTSTISTIIPITWSASATSSTTSGDNGNYNLVEGNTLSGGYYGIRHYGTNTTTRIIGNEFRNNTVADFYYYGIYNYYSEETKIVGNEVHRLNRATVSSFYAIYNYYSSENVEITDNWIHDGFAQATGSTNLVYGIYLSACDNTTGNEGLVANNLYTDNNNGGTHYPLYNSSSDGWSYYHNTIVENDPSATGTGITRLFYQTGVATDINFKNNLLYLDRGTSGAQYLTYLQTTTSDIDMDNNAFYMPAAGIIHDFGYYGADVADFAAWKAVNSSAFDQNSAEGDPFFVDPANGDYAPGAAYFNDIGDNLLSVVPTDITGAARSITPDPGAYEFTPPPGPDMSVSNVYSGGASCGTSTDIIVEVLNQGTDTVTSFTVNYTIGGVAQTPIPVTGVFATGDIDSISITGIPISGTAATTVVVTLTSIAPGVDTNPLNNVGTIDLRAGLSGTYTIDQTLPAGATNFVSFTSMADALTNYGVCGNVTINVTGVAAVYSDRLYLGEITGVSSSATVTINGNGNTLQYLSSNSGERATVTLFGADWITIDSLNIVAMGIATTDYGFGVSLSNNADHNTISNCIITVASDLTSSNYAGLTISGSLGSATTYGKSGNYNTIEGNTIVGGYYGLTVVGESADSTNGNMILNNSIEDFYYYGLYAYYHHDMDIVGNDISRPTRTTITTFYGLRAYYGKRARIDGNRIHDPATTDPASTSTMYPFYAYYMDQSIIANNVLDNINGDGTLYAFYLGYLSNTNVTHNTIVLDDAVHTGTNTPTTRGVYVVGSISGGSFDNNIIYFDRAGGSPQMFYTTVPVSNMDYNAYYIPTGSTATFGYYGGVNLTNLASWQSATGVDEHSVHLDPYFVDRANGDYTPQSSTLDGFGVDHTAIVPNDFSGMVRNVPVDAGAIEFTGAPCTGLSGVEHTTGSTSGTVSWATGASTSVDILWGPVGFMQASLTPDTVHVNSTDTSGVIAGLSSNTCYDYYLKLNCTSSIPGAPPVLGPYSMCTQCAGGALAGTYTVGGTPGASNFATLDSVIATLNGCGISAPVVFNLQGGTHNAFTLNDVDGTSATNTITFNGSASLGDSIVASVGQSAAIDLNGATHVYFNDLYIENTSGMFVVWMHNGSSNLNFDACEIMGSVSTNTTSAVMAASGAVTSPTSYGDNVSNLTVSNCEIIGNYYGIVINGSSTASKARNISLLGNNFESQWYYGIRTYYTDSVNIEENDFLTGFRNTASYGMYIYYCDNASIQRNQVYGTGTYAMMFYYSNYSNATAGSYSIVANNMLQSSGNAGLYCYYPVNVDIHHNTIVGGTTYGMYLSGSAAATVGLDVRNNIIVNTGTGTAMYVGTTLPNTVMDYNVYESGGNVAFEGVAYATLAAWQTANTGWNVNSLEGDPVFAGTSDLHVLGPLANDVGDNTVGITSDIDGDSRPYSGSTVVDIGADEFEPASCFPGTNFTMTSSTNTTATLGWDTIAGAPGYYIEYGVGGFIPGTGTTVSTTTNTYTVTGLPTTDNTAYQAYLAVACGSDTSTWVGPLNIIHSAPPILCTDDFEAYNDTVLDGQSRLFIGWAGVATDGEVSTNYANSGTNSMHIFGTADMVTNMSSFTSGAHSVQFEYYMPTGSGGYYNILHDYTGGVTNVWAIEVYIDANGTAVVNMGTNATGVIGSYAVIPGAWNTIEHIIDLDNDTAWINVNGVDANVGWQFSLGSTNLADRFNALDFYAAANAGQTPDYYIDDFCISPYVAPTCLGPTAASVPSASIGCDSVEFDWTSVSPNTTLIEYGPAGFAPGSGTMITGAASPYVLTGLTPGTNYHVYLADVCSSDTSAWVGPLPFSTDPMPVAHASFTLTSSYTATTQDVTFNATGSTNADTYSWDFGNGTTGTGANPPVVNYGLPNTAQTIILTVTNVCGSTDDTTVVLNTDIGLNGFVLDQTFKVYPNPNNGEFSIEASLSGAKDNRLTITDVSGKEVFSREIKNSSVRYSETFNLKTLAKGIYMINLDTPHGKSVRRLVIE